MNKIYQCVLLKLGEKYFYTGIVKMASSFHTNFPSVTLSFHTVDRCEGGNRHFVSIILYIFSLKGYLNYITLGFTKPGSASTRI